VVVLGLLPAWTGWRWLLLLTVLPIIWFVRLQARHLQSMIVIFLDEAAKDWKLTKLGEAVTTSEPPAKAAQQAPQNPSIEPSTDTNLV